MLYWTLYLEPTVKTDVGPQPWLNPKRNYFHLLLAFRRGGIGGVGVTSLHIPDLLSMKCWKLFMKADWDVMGQWYSGLDIHWCNVCVHTESKAITFSFHTNRDQWHADLKWRLNYSIPHNILWLCRRTLHPESCHRTWQYLGDAVSTKALLHAWHLLSHQGLGPHRQFPSTLSCNGDKKKQKTHSNKQQERQEIQKLIPDIKIWGEVCLHSLSTNVLNKIILEVKPFIPLYASKL